MGSNTSTAGMVQSNGRTGEMVQIKDLRSLNIHLDIWNDDGPNEHKPIGYI
jgi:hypothetical protein